MRLLLVTSFFKEFAVFFEFLSHSFNRLVIPALIAKERLVLILHHIPFRPDSIICIIPHFEVDVKLAVRIKKDLHFRPLCGIIY